MRISITSCSFFLLAFVLACTNTSNAGKHDDIPMMLSQHLSPSPTMLPLSNVQIVLLGEYIAYFDFLHEGQSWTSDELVAGFRENRPIICPIPSVFVSADGPLTGLVGQYDFIAVVKPEIIELYFLSCIPNSADVWKIQRGLYGEANECEVDLRQLFYMRCLGVAAMNNFEPLCDVVRDGSHSHTVYSDPSLNNFPLNPDWDPVRESLTVECSPSSVIWVMRQGGEPKRFCQRADYLQETLLGTDVQSSWSDGQFRQKLQQATCSEAQ